MKSPRFHALVLGLLLTAPLGCNSDQAEPVDTIATPPAERPEVTTPPPAETAPEVD